MFFNGESPDEGMFFNECELKTCVSLECPLHIYVLLDVNWIVLKTGIPQLGVRPCSVVLDVSYTLYKGQSVYTWSFAYV